MKKTDKQLIFSKLFPDEESCIRYYEDKRWGGNPVSPFDPSSKVYKCRNGKYKCKNTGRYFDVKTGTKFANTKLLQKREMRKDIVIELSYKGFSRASDYS